MGTSGLTYYRRVHDLQETQTLAASLAPLLHDGDAIVLSGDLGAGKTQFVKACAQALGVAAEVTSPTFNILLTYEDGRIPLNHLDLYRLDDASELEDIDYYSIIDNDTEGVAFIEWADKFPSEMPCDYLELSITKEGESNRIFRARSFGARSRQLLFVWANNPETRFTRKCSGNTEVLKPIVVDGADSNISAGAGASEGTKSSGVASAYASSATAGATR